MNTAVAASAQTSSLANDLASITPANAAFLAKPRKRLIDGAWVPAASGKTFEVRDPSSDQIIAHCALGEAADVDLAVAAARRAFDTGDWAQMKPVDRERVLHRLADLIETTCGRTCRARGHRQRQVGRDGSSRRYQTCARGVALYGGMAR